MSTFVNEPIFRTFATYEYEENEDRKAPSKPGRLHRKDVKLIKSCQFRHSTEFKHFR